MIELEETYERVGSERRRQADERAAARAAVPSEHAKRASPGILVADRCDHQTEEELEATRKKLSSVKSQPSTWGSRCASMSVSMSMESARVDVSGQSCLGISVVLFGVRSPRSGRTTTDAHRGALRMRCKGAIRTSSRRMLLRGCAQFGADRKSGGETALVSIELLQELHRSREQLCETTGRRPLNHGLLKPAPNWCEP